MRIAQHDGQRLGAPRHGNQMHVIRHEAVANQRAGMQNRVLVEQIEIHQAVGIGIEDWAAGVTALRHMVRHTLGDHARDSGHRMK